MSPSATYTVRFSHFVALIVGALLLPRTATAQDLLELLQQARMQAEVHATVAEHGLRAAPLAPVRLVPEDAEKRRLLALLTPAAPPPAYVPPPPPPFRVVTWDKVSRLENAWFEKRFEAVGWAYLGSNAITELDTSWTEVLRGRLQARFGAPTRTLADLDIDALMADDHLQFEYRLVVNDTLPLIVLDTNGPFERGVVVATDQRYREELPALRQALLQALRLPAAPAAYVDYFFNAREQAWYRAGYDGARYFTRRVARPDLSRGRPLLTGRQ